MGGTSTDVALVRRRRGADDDRARSSAGIPIKHPMVDIHTVSAGGGSVAWADGGGALRVGPRSAGAAPGPAAYGLGGDEATVTDADLSLGYLRDGAAPRRRDRRSTARRPRRRSRDRSRGARRCRSLETAVGIVTVAEAEMVRALRVISVERGIDPRELTLVAFGGAGGMHACRLAEELGISTRARAARRPASSARSGSRSPSSAATTSRRSSAICATTRPRRARGGLRGRSSEQAARDLADPELRRFADLRYRGQSFELTVAADDARQAGRPLRATPTSSATASTFPDEDVQIVSSGLTATVPVDEAAAARSRHGAPTTSGRTPRGPLRRRLAARCRFAAATSSRPATRSTARRSSSSPRRPASCGRAGARRSTTPARSSWSARDGAPRSTQRSHARPGRAVGVRQRARRDRRGDGRRARPQQLLVEHQGAARLLVRAVRRDGRDGRPGRAHPGPPRRDARLGGGRARARPRARATSSC